MTNDIPLPTGVKKKVEPNGIPLPEGVKKKQLADQETPATTSTDGAVTESVTPSLKSEQPLSAQETYYEGKPAHIPTPSTGIEVEIKEPVPIEKEQDFLKTFGKSAMNVFKYQLPSAGLGAWAAVTDYFNPAVRAVIGDPVRIEGDIITNAQGQLEQQYKDWETLTDEEKQAWHQEQNVNDVKLKEALFNTAQKFQNEGAKYTEGLVNTLDKIESPLDALNWMSNAVGQAVGQIPLSAATLGASSMMQEVGGIYLDAVQKTAEAESVKRGQEVTPQQIIQEGLDAPAIAISFGVAAGALDYVGAGKVINAFGKGAFGKELRERGMKLLLSGAETAGTEALTEGTQTALEQVAAQISGGTPIKDVKLDWKEIGEASAQGAFGAGAIAGTGAALGKISSGKDPKIDLVGLPASTVERQVATMVGNGIIDEKMAQKILAEKKLVDEADAQVPQDIQNRKEVVPLVAQKSELEKQLKESSVPPQATEAKIEAIAREYNEKTGAPLTEKEQTELEKLQEKKEEKEGEKKKELTESEQAKLEHFEKRKATLDKLQKLKTLEVAAEVTKPVVENKLGDKIQWNVFGNEEMGEWTVGEKTRTRGGQDAVTLTKQYIESNKGKTYSKEYADANGIKYTNDPFIVTHIVPVSDLQQTPVEKEAEIVQETPASQEVEEKVTKPVKTENVQKEVAKTKTPSTTSKSKGVEEGTKVTPVEKTTKAKGAQTEAKETKTAKQALEENPALSLEGFAKMQGKQKEAVRKEWESAFDEQMKNDKWVKRYNATKDAKPSKIIDLTQKQKKKNNFRKAVKKYANWQATTPRQAVLQFFAAGGRISQDEAIRRTGYKPKDLFGWTSKKGATYDDLIAIIRDEYQGEIDELDLRNEIDSIISGTKKAVYDELKSTMAGERGELQQDENADLYEATSELQEEEQDAILDYSDTWMDDALTDEQRAELDGMIADEEAGRNLTEKQNEKLVTLIEQHETNSTTKEGETRNLSPQAGDKVATSDQRKAELEAELTEVNAQLAEAESSLDKAKKSLDKDLKAKQGDIFAGGQQKSMIDDAADKKAEVDRRQKVVDKLKEKSKNLQEQSDEILKGQGRMELTPQQPIQRGKDKAVKALNKLKIDTSGKQAYSLPFPPQIWNAFVDVVIKSVEAGAEIAQAIKDGVDWLKANHPNEKADDYKSEISKEFGEEVKEEKAEPKGKKKTIVTKRTYEGKVKEAVKKKLEEIGLTRETESHEEAQQKAQAIIDEVGLDNALEAVREGDVQGAPAGAIFHEKLKEIDGKMNEETNPVEYDKLAKEYADLVEEMGKVATLGGQYNAFFNYIYQTSDLGFNAKKMIDDYKAVNKGEIPAELEAKFRQLEKDFKEVNKKLAEAEKKAKEQSDKEAIDNIKESVEREKKRRPKTSEQIRTATDRLVAKIDKGKIHRPNVFSAATPASLAWDLGLETVKTAVKATGRTAEAIAKGLEVIKGTDWYKWLNADKQKEADDAYNNFFNEKPTFTVTDSGVKIPHSTIRNFVERGVDNIEDLTTAIHEEIIKENPEVTEREVRDAITGYGKIANPNREQIEVQIRKMKDLGRVISGLEDVAEGNRPQRSGQQRDKMDAEQRAKHKELREAMKELPIDEQTKLDEQKTQLDQAKQRVQNQIEDLQREIDKGELTPKNARTVKEDAELKDLKEKRDALKKEHERIFKDEGFLNKKRVELTKKAIQRRIAELEKRIKEGDFAPKTKKPLIADTELTRLKAEKLRIQEEYDKEMHKAKLRNRTTSEKIKDHLWDAWGLTRALRATGEFSFVLLQGLVNTVAHPIQAKEAFKNSLKFMASPKKTEQWLNNLRAQDYYPMLKESKLSITEPNAEITAREELFYSGWTDMIWNNIGKIFGKNAEKWQKLNPLHAIERASVGYLDTQRVLRFLDGVEMLQEKGIKFQDNPQAYKNMADVINTFTGRASIGKLDPALLSKIFFSPRNWSSALKQTILLPRQMYKWRDKGTGKVSVAQKMAIADYSKFLGLTTSMVALAALSLNNDDDEETKVELDPRSSDFGKIKMGDTRIDPWGGRIQQIVFISRMLSDSIKNAKGEEVPLGTPYKAPTRAELMLQMATNKLAPSASMLEKYLTSKEGKDGTRTDKFGQPYEFTEDLKENVYPIYWETVKELMQEDPTALDGLLAFYAFFGGGVNVYDKKPKKEKSGRTTETRVSNSRGTESRINSR